MHSNLAWHWDLPNIVSAPSFLPKHANNCDAVYTVVFPSEPALPSSARSDHMCIDELWLLMTPMLVSLQKKRGNLTRVAVWEFSDPIIWESKFSHWKTCQNISTYNCHIKRQSQLFTSPVSGQYAMPGFSFSYRTGSSGMGRSTRSQSGIHKLYTRIRQWFIVFQALDPY